MAMRAAVRGLCLHCGWPPRVARFVSNSRLAGVIEPWERMGEMVREALEELAREDPVDIIDVIFRDIPEEQRRILKEGASHPYGCRCAVCLTYWRMIGRDPITGRYGPFTDKEVLGESPADHSSPSS